MSRIDVVKAAVGEFNALTGGRIRSPDLGVLFKR